MTIGGSGEPTLYADIGALIAGLKSLTTTPVAVLTNGSLLWRPEVREALHRADLVIPSLDAGDEETFRGVNRPPRELSYAQMVAGLVDLRWEFRGAYWLEILLIDGPSSEEPHLDRWMEQARRIGPDRVQLNTATRPPAEFWVRPLTSQRLADIAARFLPVAEVIAERQPPDTVQGDHVSPEAVLELLRRRPCSLGDIAVGLAAHRHEVAKVVAELL